MIHWEPSMPHHLCPMPLCHAEWDTEILVQHQNTATDILQYCNRSNICVHIYSVSTACHSIALESCSAPNCSWLSCGKYHIMCVCAKMWYCNTATLQHTHTVCNIAMQWWLVKLQKDICVSVEQCVCSILQYYDTAILQYCNITIYHLCNIAVLQFYNTVTYHHCKIRVLQYFNTRTYFRATERYLCVSPVGIHSLLLPTIVVIILPTSLSSFAIIVIILTSLSSSSLSSSLSSLP